MGEVPVRESRTAIPDRACCPRGVTTRPYGGWVTCRDEMLVWPEPEWHQDLGQYLGQCPRCPSVVLADTDSDARDAFDDHDIEWHPPLPPPDQQRWGTDLLAALLDPSSPEGTWAKAAVRGYYRVDSAGFTGAGFDLLGRPTPPGSSRTLQRAADPDADTVTALDIVAVTMLEVSVPPRAARRLLGPHDGPVVSERLRARPDVALHEADEDVLTAPDSPARLLWAEIHRMEKGMGRTTTSKLLARKRPLLLPVYDSRIANRMRFARRDSDWSFWSTWWREPGNAPAVTDLRASAAAAWEGRDAAGISLLRILDVAVWRYDAHYSRRPGRTSPPRT